MVFFKFLLCLNLLLPLCVCHYDPYKILGVSRHATAAEIRKAYKALVKELHPDRNKSATADEEFVKVVKAYELLTDSERRQLYDDRGIYDESASLLNRHDEGIYSFATGGLFHSSFTDGIAYLHKESISGRSFETVSLPKSFSIPQLLLFYGDYCPGCARAAATWRTITEELSPIGIDVATLHAEKERSIARRMGVSGVPAIILLIDGVPHILRESVISASRVVAFVRSKLPINELIVPISEHNINGWLSSWLDNRVRVLIFTDTSMNIRLRYLILAFQYRERAGFGVTNSEELKMTFSLGGSQDSIFLFKELSNKPVATLTMSDIPYSLMKDLVENNKFLVLPRLSSQGILETICPAESSNYRRRLCVVLITPDNMNNEVEISSLREFANSYVNPRVRFAYVFKYKQQEFVQSLHAPESNSNLVIVWRQDKSRISYEWISNWVNVNSSSALDAVLEKLLNNEESNFHVAELKELTDEHAQGFLTKVFKKINLTMTFLKSHLTKDNVVQTTSLIATILFIVAGGFIMAYLVRLEEESILAKANSANNLSNNGGTTTSANGLSSDNETVRRRCTGSQQTSTTTPVQPTIPADLKIHELRGETYNGLVRLIKPGCRTLVLLLDSDSKTALMPKFQRCVWPYRKNKSLQFCFMHVDRGAGLNWYKQLLLLSLPEQRSLNINPRNCVGTVLSLNGHRKYFCVFHATLPGLSAKKSGYRNGAFSGFEDDSDDSDTTPDIERGPQQLQLENPGSGILFTNNLLDNLANWLDRLFEGSTHRYHVNYWPEFPFK